MFLSSDFIVFIKNSMSLKESQKSALSSVVSKFSGKVAKRKSSAGEVAFIPVTQILCS